MIAAGDLLEIAGASEAAGIWHRLDGGWGIDALVGEDTRPHDDAWGFYPAGELEAVGS